MNPTPALMLAIYVLTFIFSLIGFICMGTYTANLDGNCLLFAKGNFTIENIKDVKQLVFKLDYWGNQSNCSYIFAIIILATLFSLSMVISNVFLMKKQIDRTPFSTFTTFISNSMFAILMFVAAILSSSGYYKLCNPVNEIQDLSIPYRCEDADMSSLDSEDVSSYGVFNNLKALETALWFSMIMWLIGAVLFFLKVRYFHTNNDLLQSLAYEKDRLLQRPKYSVIAYDDA